MHKILFKTLYTSHYNFHTLSVLEVLQFCSNCNLNLVFSLWFGIMSSHTLELALWLLLLDPPAGRPSIVTPKDWVQIIAISKIALHFSIKVYFKALTGLYSVLAGLYGLLLPIPRPSTVTNVVVELNWKSSKWLLHWLFLSSIAICS